MPQQENLLTKPERKLVYRGQFAAYIERIDGDYYNVVGLPVSYVYRQLKEIAEKD